MDIAILLVHLLTSLVFLSLIRSIILIVLTALWYALIDRGVINFLLAIPVRFLLVLFNVNDKVIVGTFWIEIMKAPLSVGLGGYILLLLFKTSAVYVPFGIGMLFWTLNFYFIGGNFKNHPYNRLAFICVVLMTIITLTLLPIY